MNKHIESIIAKAKRLGEYRENLRAERQLGINNNTIRPVRSSTSGNPYSMVSFGEVIQFHQRGQKDDEEARTAYQLWYRMIMEEAVYSCKAVMAHEWARYGWSPAIHPAGIERESETVDKVVEIIDDLIFGTRYTHLGEVLIPEAEFQEKYPDNNAPYTLGIGVEICAVYRQHEDGQITDIKLDWLVARWAPAADDPASLRRVILETGG